MLGDRTIQLSKAAFVKIPALRQNESTGSAGEAGATTVPKGNFREDIEGLRAVAVLGVVLFHAGTPGVGGGYIGVDVFFVISGFLITGLLWREVSSTGAVRLRRFYGARARRLLPASALVGIVTAIGSAVLLPPLESRHVLIDAVTSALYVGNYGLAVQGTDYLATDLPPSPFQHYWSLGVEEQFYLVWPTLIIGVAWVSRRVNYFAAKSHSSPRLRYSLVLTLITVGSFAISLTWTHSQPSWAFFSLPARAWELAAGGIIALTSDRWGRLPRSSAALAGWAGLALILFASNQLGTSTPYPGTAALLPVVGTALVIGAGCATPAHGVGRVLTLPAMRALGRISYSWYLWHWPVLLFAAPIVGHPLGLVGRLTAVAISGALAVLTLHLLENPCRSAVSLRRSPVRSLALGGTVTAVAACTGAVLLVLTPIPVGSGPAVQPLAITAAEPPADHVVASAAVQSAYSQVEAAVRASAGLQAVPSNLDPPLADASGDRASILVGGCLRSFDQVGQGECATGDTTSSTSVALVGDSHATMWNPAFRQSAQQRHWRLETMGKEACPLLNLPITYPRLRREYSECEQWRGQIMTRLQSERPKLVVLDMSRSYGAAFGFTSYDAAWIESMHELVAKLHQTGSKVLVLGPIPIPPPMVPTCLSGHLDDATACSPLRRAAVNDSGIAAEKAATESAGADYADLTALFCTTDRCPAIIGNTLVYRDDDHLTMQYARVLAPVIDALQVRTMAAR